MVDADWHAFCQAIGKEIEGRKKNRKITTKKSKRQREYKAKWKSKREGSLEDESGKRSFEARGNSVSRLTIGPICVVEFVFNCLWPTKLGHGAEGVGQLFVGESFAVLKSLQQCEFGHSIHAFECPKEERTAL